MNSAGENPDAAMLEAKFQKGFMLQQQGRIAEADALYREILLQCPRHFNALHLRGVIALQSGQTQRGVELIAEAIAIEPDYAMAYCNRGRGLYALRRYEEAIISNDAAIALQPDYAIAHYNRGSALFALGRHDGAVASYEKAIAIRADYFEAHYELGTTLCLQDRLYDGFDSFRTAAAGHQKNSASPYRSAKGVSGHRLKHDREQLQYLIETRASVPEAWRRTNTAIDDPDSSRYLGNIFDGPIHYEGGDRLAGAMVSPEIDAAEIETRWVAREPNMVVIDNLLTDSAIAELRRFCLGSTVWRRPYDAGYLGAFWESGFASPLLAQLAGEMRTKFPGVIGRHRLTKCWAFKYDSQLKGINIHADFAAVNFNFWITPDDANLDPKGGGLVVWDKPAPRNWNIDQYNGNENACREFLTRAGAKPIVIPYRANRAVVFNSDLFHETDRIRFRDGYRNRRINITLLYGQREETC